MRRLGIAVLTLLLMFTAAEAKPRKAKAADATKSTAAESKSDKKSDKSAADKSSAKADINTSSEADLEAVNGIGPATAKKIIANRPYASVDDLKKAGLTTAKIDKLRGSLTVGASASAPASSAKSSSSSSEKPSASSSSSSAPASGASSSSSSKPSMWERLKGKKADNASQPATSTSGTNPSSGAATTQSASAANTAQTPGGGNGKVWVNKDTKVFHREGDRWYGKTKNGEYMTEKDALAAGYRPVKEREKK